MACLVTESPPPPARRRSYSISYLIILFKASLYEQAAYQDSDLCGDIQLSTYYQ